MERPKSKFRLKSAGGPIKAKTKLTKPRLKKNPELPDYVVERTYYTTGTVGRRQEFSYYTKRSDARADAALSKADRVRVFHCKYSLVSDSKGRGK